MNLVPVLRMNAAIPRLHHVILWRAKGTTLLLLRPHNKGFCVNIPAFNISTNRVKGVSVFIQFWERVSTDLVRGPFCQKGCETLMYLYMERYD